MAPGSGALVRRGPLSPLLGPTPPESAEALRSVRFVYAAVFLAQTGLAAVVGALLATIAGTGPRPDAVVATVLLTMSIIHLPIGAALAWRVAGGPGRGAALAGATTAAVVLAAPAWFAALLAASGQAPAHVALAVGVLALAYLVGFTLTPRCAAAALRPPPAPAPATAPDTSSIPEGRPLEVP